MNNQIGIDTTTNRIKLNAIAIEQFSRPGRSSIDQTLCKNYQLITMSKEWCVLILKVQTW